MIQILFNDIPKVNFMQVQSGIYEFSLFSSFPLILLRAILEAPFVAPFCAEVYLADDVKPLSAD
jgi:hypothetical protein